MAKWMACDRTWEKIVEYINQLGELDTGVEPTYHDGLENAGEVTGISRDELLLS